MSTETKKVGIVLSKESKKIKDQHDSAMGKLVAVFNGESNLNKPGKIDNSSVSTLITEVLEEEVEGKKKAFKEKARSLISSKVKYNAFLKQKQQEFQKAVDAKTKEFTKEANDLLQMVEDIDSLQQQYTDALTAE